MKDVFGVAMRRATLLTRRGDVTGATRTIQAALAGGMHRQTPTRSNDEPRLPRPELRLIGSAKEIPAEPESPKGISDEAVRQERQPRIRKPLGEVLRTLRAGRLRSGISGLLPGLGMPGIAQATSTPTIPPGANSRCARLRVLPAPELTSSTSRPRWASDRGASLLCCMAASRTPTTSRPELT